MTSEEGCPLRPWSPGGTPEIAYGRVTASRVPGLTTVLGRRTVGHALRFREASWMPARTGLDGGEERGRESASTRRRLDRRSGDALVEIKSETHGIGTDPNKTALGSGNQGLLKSIGRDDRWVRWDPLFASQVW